MLYELGDKVITKKQHPCGGREWEVVRSGIDVKIKCLNCGRIVMLPALELLKKVKKRIPANPGEGSNGIKDKV